MNNYSEEIRVKDRIMTLLNCSKYKNSYSFDENDNKDILIYKKNGNWHFEIYYKDDRIVKLYTNILDMADELFVVLNCFLYWKDTINCDLRYPISTRVLVDNHNFDLVTSYLNNKKINLTLGTIVGYSSEDGINYIIELDNKKTIIATNGIRYSLKKDNEEKYSFMSIEQLIKYLSLKICSREATQMNDKELDTGITDALKEILGQVKKIHEELINSGNNKTK